MAEGGITPEQAGITPKEANKGVGVEQKAGGGFWQQLNGLKDRVRQAEESGQNVRDMITDPKERDSYLKNMDFMYPRNEGESELQYQQRINQFKLDFMTDEEKQREADLNRIRKEQRYAFARGRAVRSAARYSRR